MMKPNTFDKQKPFSNDVPNDRLPSLHLFSEHPDDGRSYSDLDFIQKYKEARRELFTIAIEAISPSDAAPLNMPSKAPEGLGYLKSRLLELCSAARCNLILFNSPANEALAFEMMYHFAQLAGAEKKILIVDCNLRKPAHPKKDSKSQRSVGLNEYVSGKTGLDEIIFRTELQNVFWIGGGEALEFPMRALMSNRFLQLMELLKTQFDLILLHSSPYRQCIDAFVLAKFLRPILVLALKGEKWDDIKDIRKELAVLDLKILGLMDNR